MKQYRNKTTGEIYDGNSIVMHRNGKEVRIFNPTPQHLADAGYEEYEPVVSEPSKEQIAAQQRAQRMAEIDDELRSLDYLTSKEVDGEDMSKYNDRYGGDWKSYRRSLREEYRTLEQTE